MLGQGKFDKTTADEFDFPATRLLRADPTEAAWKNCRKMISQDAMSLLDNNGISQITWRRAGDFAAARIAGMRANASQCAHIDVVTLPMM